MAGRPDGKYSNYTFGAESRPKGATSPHPPFEEKQPREALGEVVRRDFFEEKPQWPFSCYAPFGLQKSEFGSDTSFEELRYHEMGLIKIAKQPKEKVVQQTATVLDQVKEKIQQYYNQKCGGNGENVGNQMLLMRRGPQVGRAGFGVLTNSQQGGLNQNQPIFPTPSTSSSPLPLLEDTPIEENVNPPSQEEDSCHQGKENPWLASEFEIIPDEPPPERYI